MIIRKTNRKNKSEKVFITPDKNTITFTASVIFNNYDVFGGVPSDSYLKDIARAIRGSMVDNYSTTELGNAIFMQIKEYEDNKEKAEKKK